MSQSNTVNDLLKPHSYETALTQHDGQDFLDVAGPFPDVETAQTAIDAWGHGYNHVRPHQSLGMAIPVSVFRLHRLNPSRQPRTDTAADGT